MIIFKIKNYIFSIFLIVKILLFLKHEKNVFL